MANLDQISEAIGALRSEVKSVDNKIEDIKSWIRQSLSGVKEDVDEHEDRIRDLEDAANKIKGGALVLGSIAGGAAALCVKCVSFIVGALKVIQ